MAICDLATVKLNLGISGTTQDAVLTLWLNAAISAVINYCGTSFESQLRTEYYQPDGWNLLLRNRPVISVTSVYEDTNGFWNQSATPFPAETLLTAGVDYALQEDAGELVATYGYISRSGIIRRLNRSWPRRYPRQLIPGWTTQNLSLPDYPSIGSVKVVYTSGYTTLPAAITQAVCFEVSAYKQRAKLGGANLTSESLGEYSYSLGQQIPVIVGGLLSDAARNLLAPFTALGKGLAI